MRDLIRETFGLEQDDVRSTSMGATGEDVQLSPAARQYVPYQIECKNKSKSAIHTIYNQAKEHGQHEPLVVYKLDRDIPLAIVSAEHFFQLLKKANASNSSNETK